MKFVVLSIVCIFNLLVCGNANEVKQLGDSLVNAFKSNLDTLFVDDYMTKVQLGSSAGFHFVFELALKSNEITGFGQIGLIHSDLVANENGDHKFVAQFSLGKDGMIKSAVSINGYNTTLVTVDIVDELVVDLSVDMNAKSDLIKVNIANLKQIRLRQLPNVSSLNLVQDKLVDAFIRMFNTQAKTKLVHLVREIVEREFKKINGGY